MVSYSRAKYVTQSTDFPGSVDSKPITATFATFADLPATSTTVGNIAFVAATNKLYIWSGVGWYLVAEVTNASPTAITGVAGTYNLATDGTATTITAVSTDPEGFALTWSYAVTSGSLAITPAASAIAVVNNGSGAYTLSGGATGDNSNVDIVVGQTVNFTVNASGHPFYIRDSNGGANVSSPAATGQGATSGVVSWTPNTAGTYYYQCGNHAAMVGTITVGAATVSATVAQADNVFTITPSTNTAAANTFSLTFNVTDGLNGSVSAVSAFTLSFSVTNSRYTALSVKATATGSNQTFDDASASNLTISTTGNASTSTFSPHRQGGYATYFDGNDRIDISTAFLGSHTTGNASTSTLTIESWVYQTARGSNNGIDGNAASIMSKHVYFNFGIDNDGHLHGHHYSGTQHNLETTATVPLNTWTHVAMVVSGAQIKLYINGNLGATGTWYGMQAGTSLAGIGGSNQSHPEKFTGYMHDIRVSDNARYTTNFTPADALTTDSNTDLLIGKLQLRDLSSNSVALTLQGDVKVVPFNTSTGDNALYSKADHGVSVYLDGTGDYISAEDDASFSFGTGDFTVECWLFHQNASALYYDLIGTASNANYIGANRGGWIFGYYHTHSSTYALKFGYQYNNAFPDDISFSKTLNADTWYHIALTRQGNQLKYFVDGIQVGSTVTNSTNIVSTEPLTIGTGATVTSQYVTGYMSDVRVVKGTAVYTSNFTPPTAPLTAITNTKFLLNPEPSISDLSQSSEITCVGDAATSTTQVKFAGTKSIYLDGTGDYLQISNVKDSWISGYTGDYTIEFWWYPTNVSVGSYQEILTAGVGFQLYIFNGGGLSLALSDNNSSPYFWHPTEFHTMVNNTWQHIAVVRNGNVYTVYVGGVSKATTTDTDLINTGTDPIQLGISGGSLYPAVGYFQDLRVTKGLARYTSGFTPPTAELQG